MRAVAPLPIIRAGGWLLVGPAFNNGKVHSKASCRCSPVMGIQLLARHDRRLRRLVRPIVAAGLLLRRVKHAAVVDCFLRARSLPELPALHGDRLPRLPSFGRLPQIPRLHRAYHTVAAGHRGGLALLVSRSAVSFYAVRNLEPLALQRSELWDPYDVCPPRRRRSTRQCRTARTLRGIP